MVIVRGCSIWECHNQPCLCHSLDKDLGLVCGSASEQVFVIEVIPGWVMPVEVPKLECMGITDMAVL
jgi:hypothetical protein